MSQFRVLHDQLSGLTQCCNGLFFVGSGIKSNGYNFIEAIPGHHVILEILQRFTILSAGRGPRFLRNGGHNAFVYTERYVGTTERWQDPQRNSRPSAT